MSSDYRLSYNFGKYQIVIGNFFTTLKQNSSQFFSSQILDGKISKANSVHEFAQMNSFIKNVEEYLHYYYLKDPKNFDNVRNAVKKLKAISVLDNSDRGIYGVTHSTNIIQINPTLSGNRYLTPEERTRLYVSHELGHMVNKEWMHQVTKHLSSINNQDLTPHQRQMFYDGFSLLDEATTQDRAEDIAYFYANKQRPLLRRCQDSRGMYSGEIYKTNFDFYGELQEPAIIFSRTLRGIGKIDADQRALSLLSKRALSPNFVNTILNEYQRDGQMPNLYNEFHNLGILKNASYARFGYAPRSFLDSSKGALQKFKDIATSLRDFREPFGFEPFD